MSSSGVDSINSGPLIIRTYLDATANNTYVLGQYDRSIPPNRILVTSTGGLLAPSDSIVISSISVSTINAITINSSTINVSTINSSTINTSTINVSTINISNMFVSTAYVSTLSTCDIFCPDVLTISSFRQTYLGAERFEYRSSDPSNNFGAFKIELYGSNLLAYKSTIGIDATIVQNNGGGQLVLATDEPIMYFNGAANGNNHVGIGTSTPQAHLHIGEPNFSQAYTTPGTTSYPIPPGVTSVNFEIVGAGGPIQSPFYTTSGAGGYIKGTIDTTAITTLTIKVGGVTNGNNVVPSGASYISNGSDLLVMAGAGGAFGACITYNRQNLSIQGGGGGGGSWNSVTGGFVSNGLTGADPGSGTDPTIVGGGGQGGNGLTGGIGGVAGFNGQAGNPGDSQSGISPNYTESNGGVGPAIPVAPISATAVGGNGFSGGGASGWGYFATDQGSQLGQTGGGGGGSSYYKNTGVTIINSLNGANYSQSPFIGNNYGLAGNGGYVKISYSSGEPSLVTDGAVGVGTTDPLALLDVMGSAISRQIVTSSITANSVAINSGYFGKYTFISTLGAVTLTLPAPSDEGSILVFRNLNTDAASTVTLTNTITGSGTMPANTAGAFVFTTYAGNLWAAF